MRRPGQIVLAFLAAMMTLVLAARGEDFYEIRLQAGETAYMEKRIPEALDHLRIAAFGFLEQPEKLAESLVWLTLAQTAAGKGAEADASLARFLEVEKRFSPYAKLKLEPAIRDSFQALVLRRVTPASLSQIPAFAGWVQTEDQKLAKLPPRERIKALEASRKREPRDVRWPLALAREAATAGDASGTADWASKALELDSSNVEALALRGHALSARGRWSEALADLDRLPPAELTSRPELLADRFVCLVEAKDWSRAREAWAQVPPAQRGRPDVARSQQRLASQ